MEILSSPYVVVVLFFLISFTYSSVGLGGGSSYTALMVILGFSSLDIPLVSLTLNLFVTSLGSFNFIRNKHAKIKIILPFLISSVPMAYIGGTLTLQKEIFYWILLISLIFVVIRIYIWENTTFRYNFGDKEKIAVSLITGSVLGLVAGIVGIGGGIYLVPLIILFKIGTEKEAAACGAVFVWLNSFSGLVSRFYYNPINLADHIPLILAVIAGGAIGSYMGAFRFSPRTMEKMLGIVVIVAIVFLTKKTIAM